MLGGGGSLDIEGMVIIGVDGTVTEIIDVGQQAQLQTEVGIVSKARQDTECPATAHVGTVLRKGRGNGRN